MDRQPGPCPDHLRMRWMTFCGTTDVQQSDEYDLKWLMMITYLASAQILLFLFTSSA